MVGKRGQGKRCPRMGTGWGALLLAAGLWPDPVAAQSAIVGDPAVLDRCLVAGGGVDCIGRMADACRADNAEGETTLGITLCAIEEGNTWARLMRGSLARLEVMAQTADAAAGDWAANLAGEHETLLAAQAAWTDWREAECAYVYAGHGIGPGRGIAREICRMRMTALRTLELEGMVRRKRPPTEP